MTRHALLAGLLILGGCSVTVEEDTRYHIVAVDTDGRPLVFDRTGENEFTQTRPGKRMEVEFQRHIHEVVRRSKEEGRILIFIHGGMVSLGKAADHAGEALDEIRRAGFYPIFVNWEAGLGASYYDHLFRIRRGQPAWYAPITSPFHFLADLGRAVTRLPITYYWQGLELLKDSVSQRPAAVPRDWERQVWLDRDDESKPLDTTLDAVRQVAPGALRLVTTPLLDTIGPGGFLNMRRRTRLLLRRDHDFVEGEHRFSGGLAYLMEEIGRQYGVFGKQLDRLGERNSCPSCHAGGEEQPRRPQMTLVAHSMGTIVANQLLRHFDDSTFHYETIVYMGAACTVKEFKDEALPYIKAHPPTRFYNLCLHPAEDRWDMYLQGTVPNGSLLEWIDNYLTQQQTPMDRTLGKWNNIARALPILDDLEAEERSRIFVRGFGRAEGFPLSHGDFNDLDFPYRYWQEEFWDFTTDPRTRERSLPSSQSAPQR